MDEWIVWLVVMVVVVDAREAVRHSGGAGGMLLYWGYLRATRVD
jgi:hypothetical protein